MAISGSNIYVGLASALISNLDNPYGIAVSDPNIFVTSDSNPEHVGEFTPLSVSPRHPLCSSCGESLAMGM